MLKVLLPVCLIAVVNCQKEAFIAVRDGFRGILAQNRDECLAKTKADPVLVEKLVNDFHFPKDEALKCYIECITSKIGFLTDDMKLHPEVLKKNMPSEGAHIVDQVVEKCASVGSGTNCDIAYEILRCVYHSIRDLLHSPS